MQFLHRLHSHAPGKTGLGLLLVTIVLGIFLAFQVGLMVWVYVKQWL